MEQTLGKRIAEHRKRLGLTQDGLAEKLGITAQAVSKWENDLSCPDITMLPKLAEIFGITTDELLGVAAQEPVHTGEVVSDSDEPHIHYEDEGGSWNFHWDAGRKYHLTFPICVLLVGLLTLVAKYKQWDVSFWDILWPTGLLVYGVAGILSRFSVFNLAMVLFGGYSLGANLNIWHLVIGEDMVFPICVVLFGLGLLVDALRKPKKPSFRITNNGKHTKNTRIDCENSGNQFRCNVSFGETTHVVSADRLQGGSAHVHFGELTVDLSEVEEVADGCYIETNCHFGEICVKVPRRFRVESHNRTAFANVDVSGHPDSEPEGTIDLVANANFGEISIVYI